MDEELTRVLVKDRKNIETLILLESIKKDNPECKVNVHDTETPAYEKSRYCKQNLENFDLSTEEKRRLLIDSVEFSEGLFLPRVFFPNDLLYSIRQQCDMGCGYCYQSLEPGKESQKLRS